MSGDGKKIKAAKLLLQRAAEISTRKICQAEKNVIEDCFPQPCAVRASKSGAVKKFGYKYQAEGTFLSLPAIGEQRLFLPA